jgi:PKD repeat protein
LLYDDGTQDFDVQSPTHVFTTAGTHTVALVASNGSGSDETERSVEVRATLAGPAAISLVKRLLPVSPGRWSLPGVSVHGTGTSWLRLQPLSASRAVAFLRLRDDSGRLLCERRLVADPGRVSRFDLGAWGARGRVTVELVSPDRLDAAILTSAASARKDGSDE